MSVTTPEAPSRGHTTDHLANERTFLAWIRTALGLIGLGFVLARMGLFLRQLASASLVMGDHVPRFHGGGEFLISGVAFLFLGTIACGWSGWRYDQSRRAIDSGRYEPAFGSVVALTVMIVIGGLVLVGLVLWRTLGPEGF
jgi:putative membrane protein